MDATVLDWDEAAFRLDHRQFAYAGKFVTPGGKAVVAEPDAPPICDQPGPREGFVRGVLAAVAFSPDRTDRTTLWLRYITVRTDRRGEGIGPQLAAFVAERAAERGYERVRIAVNNPFAYDAVYKAGFAYTGRTTGIAELVCDRSAGELAARKAVENAESAGTDGDERADVTNDRSAARRARYREGLDAYRERDLSPAESAFCERVTDRGPPAVVTVST